MSCWNSRRRSTHLRHIHCITVAEAAYNKPECAQESSRVHMLIANKKKKKKQFKSKCSTRMVRTDAAILFEPTH